jgi:hypothetical protein
MVQKKNSFVTLGPQYQIRFVYESTKISQLQARAFGELMPNILQLIVNGKHEAIWQLLMKCATLPEQSQDECDP